MLLGIDNSRLIQKTKKQSVIYFNNKIVIIIFKQDNCEVIILYINGKKQAHSIKDHPQPKDGHLIKKVYFYHLYIKFEQ